MEKLIEQIETYRESKKQTKRDFYRALVTEGISENYIYKLLDGTRKPGKQFMVAVAAAYPDLRQAVQEAVFGNGANEE